MDRAALSQFSKDDLIALLLAQEARHAAEIAALQARIAELERRLGLNSGNSAGSYGVICWYRLLEWRAMQGGHHGRGGV